MNTQIRKNKNKIIPLLEGNRQIMPAILLKNKCLKIKLKTY